MSAAKDRTGEIKMMTCCKMKAKIIREYKGKVDVLFENGVIVRNRRYYDFNHGRINVYNYMNHTKEKYTTADGRLITILEYTDSKNVTVEVEGKGIFDKQKYCNVKAGKIVERQDNSLRALRMGEEKMMNCGEIGKIIGYENANDIDIIFPDGTIVYHKRYKAFDNGQIDHPGLKEETKKRRAEACNGRYKNLKNERIGTKRTMKCGMACTVIDYDTRKNITVEFEDGTKIYNANWGNFSNGAIQNSNLDNSYRTGNKKGERLGKRLMMNCGDFAKIIEYTDSNKMTVMFDDGNKVKNVSFRAFSNGEIINPKYPKNYTKILKAKKLHLGKKALMNCGQICEIIDYDGTMNITVKFEDGTIVKNKCLADFKSGSIGHPDIPVFKHVSFIEFVIVNALSQANFSRIRQEEYAKKGFGKKELDAFNEELSIGFEYDGAYWHKDMGKDLFKNKLCKDNDVFLIRLREKGLPDISDDNCRCFIRKNNKSYKDLENLLSEIISFINKKYNVNYNKNFNLEDSLDELRILWNQQYPKEKV